MRTEKKIESDCECNHVRTGDPYVMNGSVDDSSGVHDGADAVVVQGRIDKRDNQSYEAEALNAFHVFWQGLIHCVPEVYGHL